MKTLARTCLLTFKVVNVTTSSNPVIAKAVKECELLINVKTKQTAPSATAHWSDFEKPGECSPAVKDHVTKELGTKLINLIDKPSRCRTIVIAIAFQFTGDVPRGTAHTHTHAYVYMTLKYKHSVHTACTIVSDLCTSDP